jgi:GH25 family lysozyme M1 (1,4-beta-N-acetylmuramidase)
MPEPIRGIDVSGTHQGEIDWQAVAQSGIKFAYCKATQGRSFRDSRYARNMAAARANGIMAGPYHFYEWAADPISQATNFMAAITMAGTLQAGNLPPAVDFEQPGDGAGPFVDSIPVALQKMQRFIDYVEAATRRPCVVYTYPYAWRKVLGDTRQFAAQPLWLADYTPPPGPYPGGWTTHAVLQTGTQGRVPGIMGVVDTDEFNGDEAALREFAGLTAGHNRYFPETGYFLAGGFLDYWQDNGGIVELGLPIGPEVDAGAEWPYKALPELQGYTVQLFEHALLLWKPGEDVTEGRVGALVEAMISNP